MVEANKPKPNRKEGDGSPPISLFHYLFDCHQSDRLDKRTGRQKSLPLSYYRHVADLLGLIWNENRGAAREEELRICLQEPKDYF